MSRDYWRKWWISLSSQLRPTGWRARFAWSASLPSLVGMLLHLLVNGCPTRNQGCLDFDSASSSLGDTTLQETRPRSNVVDWIVHYIQFSWTAKQRFLHAGLTSCCGSAFCIPAYVFSGTHNYCSSMEYQAQRHSYIGMETLKMVWSTHLDAWCAREEARWRAHTSTICLVSDLWWWSVGSRNSLVRITV